MDKKKLQDMFEAFINTQYEDDGGWPDVTQEDHSDFLGLVRAISDYKFGRDCDGDSVYDISLLNRRWFRPLYFIDLKPVSYKFKSPEEVDREVYRYSSNVHTAATMLRDFMSKVAYYRTELGKGRPEVKGTGSD